MAEFPRARERLGFVPTAAVRADLDVRTGEAAVGQAIAGLGEAMMDLGIRFDAMEGKAQSDIAVRDARLSMVDTINALRLEDDVSKWDAIFETHTQKVSALTPENKRGARQYNTAINGLIPIWREQYLGMKSTKIEDNMIAASIVKVNDLMASATIETMGNVIKKIKTELEVRDRLSPSILKETTEKDKANVQRNVELDIAKRMALTNPEATLASIKGDKLEGFNTLTPDDILRIRNMATLAQSTAVTIRHEEFWQDLQAGSLTILRDKIDKSNLPIIGIGGKQWWTNIVNAREKEIIFGLIPTTISGTRSNLLSRVYEINTGTKTKQQIQQELLEHRHIYRDLSETDFNMLWNRAEQEFKSWRAAQMTKTLGEIRSQIVRISESMMEQLAGLYTGEEFEIVQNRRQKEEDKYAEAVFEMESWLAEHPEATRDDFYKAKRSLLNHYRGKTPEEVRAERVVFPEEEQPVGEPTARQLMEKARNTTDEKELLEIFEQGVKLGYWK